MFKYTLILLTLLSAIVMCGCSDSDERKHPLYQRGEKARAAGNGEEAAEAFKELLKRKPESTYAHLRLASVYDELLNDPQQAALHYKLYLEAAPDAPDAEEVQIWLVRAEKRTYELLRQRFESAPPQRTPAPAAAESGVSNEKIQEYEKKIAELEHKIKQYHARYVFVGDELKRLRKLDAQMKKNAPPPENARVDDSAAAAGNTDSYIVQENDTPGKIAYKVYGKSSLYKIILQANPGVTERNLRPGMRLVIPPKPADK